MPLVRARILWSPKVALWSGLRLPRAGQALTVHKQGQMPLSFVDRMMPPTKAPAWLPWTDLLE